jgi:thiosulfate/3-mercaptopyruvate sulfurtransferase
MLRATGHEAAVLDGGIDAWDGPIETGPSTRAAASFTSREWPHELLATIDNIAAGGDAVLLDARDRDRYSGAFERVDPRPGHIPGARSLPVREHVGPDGRLLGRESLRERLRAVGVGDDSAVISYCGSGVTACHNLLVLSHVGLPAGRLYPGSWSQWSADPSRPAETGASAAEAGPAGR